MHPTEIEVIESFIQERSVNPASARTYKTVLIRFYRYCRARAIDYREARVTTFFDYRKTFVNCSDLTVYNHFNLLKLHYKWLKDNEFIKHTPVIATLAKQPRRYHVWRKRPLTAQQVSVLLSGCNTETLAGLRDKILLQLLAFNGIRIIEACRIDIEDFTNEFNGLFIQRKGDKRKTDLIRLPEPTKTTIEKYLHLRPDASTDEPLLIGTSFNSPGNRLRPESASRIVKNHLIKSGLKAEFVTGHSLRHTAATLLLQSGCTVNDLQGFLGHKNFTTSQIYLQYQEAQRIYESNFPEKIAKLINQC